MLKNVLDLSPGRPPNGLPDRPTLQAVGLRSGDGTNQRGTNANDESTGMIVLFPKMIDSDSDAFFRR